MPNLAELNVVVGADVKALDAGLNKAKESLLDFYKLNKSLEALKPFDANAAQYVKAAKSIDQINDALVQLKISQKGTTDPAEIKAYSNVIEDLTHKVKYLSLSEAQLNQQVDKLDASLTKQASNELSSKSSIIATNSKLVASNTTLLASNSKLSEGLATLSKGFSFVRQAAYLLPGIGIAGIFNLAFEAIGAAADKLGIFTTAAKSSTIATDQYTGAMKKNYEAAGQQLAKVSEIVAGLE